MLNYDTLKYKSNRLTIFYVNSNLSSILIQKLKRVNNCVFTLREWWQIMYANLDCDESNARTQRVSALAEH